MANARIAPERPVRMAGGPPQEPGPAIGKRRSRIILSLLAAVVGFLVLAVYLGSERIGTAVGQLALDEINASLRVGRVTADEIRARWNLRRWRLGIEFSGVRYEISPDVGLAEAESIAVDLSWEGLTDWHIADDALAIHGLSAAIDAASSGGPFLAAPNADYRLPLVAILAVTQGSDPADLPQLLVRAATFSVRTSRGEKIWRFGEIIIDLGVIEDGGVVEVAASLLGIANGEESWVDLRAEWGADEPATITVGFESFPASILSPVMADQVASSDLLEDFALSGSAHISLNHDFGVQAIDGGFTALPYESAASGGMGEFVQSIDGQFLFDTTSQRMALSGISAAAGPVELFGEMEIQFDEGRPVSMSGGVEIASEWEEGADSGHFRQFDAAIEFDFFPDEARLELAQYWVATETAEGAGYADIFDFSIGTSGLSGRVLDGELTLTAFGSEPETADEVATGGFTVALASVSGDFLYNSDSRRLTIGSAAASVVGTGSRVSLEDLSVPIPIAVGEISGKLSAAPLVPAAVVALWPPGLSPAARNWFESSVQSGEMSLEMSITGTLAEPLVMASFDFRDAEFVPSQGLPLIRGAAGTGRYDSSTFVVLLDGGFLVSEGERFNLTRASFQIPDLGDVPVLAAIDIEGAGAPPVALHIAEAFSLGVAENTGWMARLDSGVVSLSARIALRLTPPVSVLNWEVGAEGRGLSSPAGAQGLAVESANFDAAFGSGPTSVRGTALVNGLRVTFGTESEDSLIAADGTAHFTIDGSLEVPEDFRDAIAEESITYRMDVDLQGRSAEWRAELDVASAEIRLGDAILNRSGERGVIEASGSIDVDGVAVSSVSARLSELALNGDVAPSPVGGWQVPLRGNVSAALLSHFGLPPDGANGSVPLEIEVSSELDEPSSFVARVGLESTRGMIGGSGMEVFGIASEPQPGDHLVVAGILQDGQFVLRNVAGTYRRLQFAGEPVPDPEGSPMGGWYFEVQIGNSSQFAVEFNDMGGNRYEADLVGEVLDISGSSGSVTGAGPGTTSPSPAAEEATPQIELRINVRRLQVTGNMWMDNATGRIVVQHNGSVNGELRGFAFGSVDAEVRFSQLPSDDLGYSVSLSDAGTVLSALGITSRVEGGRLLVTPRHVGGTDATASYRVEGTSLRVSNAPMVGKLMSFISGIGLIEYVLTGNLTLDSVAVNVTQDGEVLRLSDGSVESASIAIAFAGDYDQAADHVDIYGYGTPLRFVSRALGELPIIGNVVQGPGGKGIIGAGFTINGPSNDPEVDGSPLDLLIPLLPQLRFQQEQRDTATTGQ